MLDFQPDFYNLLDQPLIQSRTNRPYYIVK